MTERVRRAGQVSWAVVGVAVLLAIVGLIAWTLRVIFPPLILAGTIVFLLNPLVNGLQRRGVPRAGGAALAYLGVMASLVGVGLLIYPIATTQARELGDDWPEIQAKAEGWIDDAVDASEGTFLEFTRDDLEGAFSADDTTFRQQLDQARELGLRIFHVLLILVLAPIIAFYLLVDLPRVREAVESLIPPASKDEVLHVARRLHRAIGGFFRGQLMVAAIVGTMCSIGLLAIGLRFWFLVGMIAGLFNVIPLIGPWVGGVPGVVIALTTGSPLQAVGVVVVMAGAQQVDNHFITPQVMQRAVQLHPAAVILALLAGGTLGGFFGLLMAVPVTAVLKILCGHVWRTHVLGEALPPFHPDEAEAAEAPPPNVGGAGTDGGAGAAADRAEPVLPTPP